MPVYLVLLLLNLLADRLDNLGLDARRLQSRSSLVALMLSLSVHIKLLVDFLAENFGMALVLLELSRLITRLDLRVWLVGAPTMLPRSLAYVLRGLF